MGKLPRGGRYSFAQWFFAALAADLWRPKTVHGRFRGRSASARTARCVCGRLGRPSRSNPVSLAADAGPFDGSSAPRALTSGHHRDTAPRWSPDGGSLAFASDRDDDRSQCSCCRLQGGEPRQLDVAQARRGHAVWSPTATGSPSAPASTSRRSPARRASPTRRGNRRGSRSSPACTTRADGEGFYEAVHRHLFVARTSDGWRAPGRLPMATGTTRSRPGRRTAACSRSPRTANVIGI